MMQIVFKYGPDGTYSQEGRNFAGTQCDRAMQPYENRQGIKPGARTSDSDLADTETESEQQRERS